MHGMADENTQRVAAGTLDEVLGQAFRVLDDGFVRVVDYMGSDESIVQAARISYGKGTKKVSQDRGLIRYLLRHRHTTPFEMCDIKLHVRVPMDCWRQWIRHRTASVNEYSTRYSEAIDAAQRTAKDEWREQSESNRQGSGALIEPEAGEVLSQREEQLHTLARQVYNERLAAGVAREQARKDLPLATYTEAYWKTNLHNLLHFVELRYDDHAQEEIRKYAQVLGEEIVRRWCPLTWEAFVDYRREAMSLTRLEIEVIRCLAAGDENGAVEAARRNRLLTGREKQGKPGRELEELLEKLAVLSLPGECLRAALDGDGGDGAAGG